MAITIEMPKLSDTMSEGKILSWKKREGDPVSAGEVLAEIESDKANMEMEAYDTGYVRKLLLPEGGAAPVGAPIAILTEDPSEDIGEVLATLAAAKPAAAHAKEARGKGGEAAPPAPRSPAVVPAPSAASPPSSRPSGGRRVLASPLAVRMAAEYRLDLSAIRGSGPEGRITKRDIESALKAGGAAAPAAGAPRSGSAEARPSEPAAKAAWAPVLAAAATGDAYEDVPISTMRRIIGERLQSSVVTAPHFYVTVDVDMEAAVAARERLKDLTGLGITFNDMIVKAVAVAAQRHPAANASWQGDSIRYHKSVDVAVAVSIPDGLITPVVRACHLKGLAQISEEARNLAERARQRKLSPEEYRGSTFTISNLGMLGVEEFTAVINPPEACILAVGAIRQVPVVEGGVVVPGTRMKLTLSCDHRVIDGAQAAQFLRDLRAVLENPVSLAL